MTMLGLVVCGSARFAPHVRNKLEKAIAHTVSFLEVIGKSMSVTLMQSFGPDGRPSARIAPLESYLLAHL
jgi:hypothetical protein